MELARGTERRGAAGARLALACSISPERVARLLTLVVAVLTLLSVSGWLAVWYLPDFPLRDFTAGLFDLDQEVNFPTAYSTLAILVCSALLALIARSQRLVGGPRQGRPWQVLSLIFLGLAFDELLSFHEELIDRVHFGAFSRFTAFSWVVVGAGFVVIVAVAFSRFLRRLPAATRRLFLLAGALFVGGSVVIEVLGGYYGGPGRQDTLAYVVVAHAEELLEMAGIVVFIYALLSYLRRAAPTVVLRLHIEGEGPSRRDEAGRAPPRGGASTVRNRPPG
jgi:hypothetical protein